MDPRMDMYMPMASFGPLFVMWAAMMAAMMLPTMVPTLRSYEDLMVSANGTRAGWLGVLLGYFIMWVGFAALIAAVQLALLFGGVIDMLGIAKSRWFAAACCWPWAVPVHPRQGNLPRRVPFPDDVFHGPLALRLCGRLAHGAGAWRVLRGCCWGFMALGFAGGVMNLAWMGLATLFMVLEKLPQIGHIVTKPMGVC